MESGNLIRIHCHNQNGSQERKRLQTCFVRSLDKDGLLKSLGSFGSPVVTDARERSDLNCCSLWARIPANLSAVQPAAGGPEPTSGGNGISRPTVEQPTTTSVMAANRTRLIMFPRVSCVGSRRRFKFFSPDAALFPGCA